MNTRHLKIRGQKWKIVFGRPPKNGCSGYCDPNVRTIWVAKSNRTAEEKRMVIIHEVLHALFYDLREEVVEEAEAALLEGLRLVD